MYFDNLVEIYKAPVAENSFYVEGRSDGRNIFQSLDFIQVIYEHLQYNPNYHECAGRSRFCGTLLLRSRIWLSLRTPKWGPSIPNKIGWILMEAPIFVTMLGLYLDSDRVGDPAIIVITLLFLTHYLQRTFIFPLLIRGESKMPLSIIAPGNDI